MKFETKIEGCIIIAYASDCLMNITNDAHGFYVTGLTHGINIDTRTNGPALSTLDKALRYAKRMLNPHHLG